VPVALRLMLYTHLLVWWLQDYRGLLGARLLAALGNPRHEVFVSAVSAWEIAIKAALGKVRLPKADLEAEIEANGFTELAVRSRHGLLAGRLSPVHDDPFDRMLVAQAQIEGLTLATKDAALARYGVAVLGD